MSPLTEEHVARAFREKPLITAKEAAALLHVDEKTLRMMAEHGVIRSVIVGASTRRYTEADIRAYLAGERFGEIKPCQSTSRRTAHTGIMTSSTRVIGFTEARAKRLALRRKR
jgi:excisionase family DNA binding protein